MKVLFVCTGNSCRSVMAHFLLNHMAKQGRLKGWEAKSCGIAAEESFPIPPAVHSALAQRGIPSVRHVPKPVTQEILGWADAVLAMTRMHRDFLLDQFPEFRAKIHLFREFTLSEKQDVEDPIGQPEETYFQCRDLLERGLKALLERYAAEKH